jgi:hypothetical protein
MFDDLMMAKIQAATTLDSPKHVSSPAPMMSAQSLAQPNFHTIPSLSPPIITGLLSIAVQPQYLIEHKIFQFLSILILFNKRLILCYIHEMLLILLNYVLKYRMGWTRDIESLKGSLRHATDYVMTI